MLSHPHRQFLDASLEWCEAYDGLVEPSPPTPETNAGTPETQSPGPGPVSSVTGSRSILDVHNVNGNIGVLDAV